MKDLMIPRYEVIADYPNSPFDVRDILYERDKGDFRVWCDANRIWVESTDESDLVKYPHLFRKLQWWEKRDISEMPEYVRTTKSQKVYKVNMYSKCHTKFYTVDKHSPATGIVYFNGTTPATEQEYTDYITSKQTQQ